MKNRSALWGIFCIALTLSTPAFAEPIALTSGSVTIGFGRGAFRTHVFTLHGPGLDIDGWQPDGPSQPLFFPACHEFAPCSAGQTTSPSGTISVLAIGSAEIDGTDYALTQYFGGPANRFTFTAGDVVIPGGMSTMFSLQTPFTFSGLLSVFAMNSSSQWEHVRNLSLTGMGTATVNFRPFGSGFAIQSVHYEFAPTPEPATLLLLGTGAALVLRRMRCRRMPAKNQTHNS